MGILYLTYFSLKDHMAAAPHGRQMLNGQRGGWCYRKMKLLKIAARAVAGIIVLTINKLAVPKLMITWISKMTLVSPGLSII